MSYFSVKVWTGKKHGKKTTPESLLCFPAIAALEPSIDCPNILYLVPVSKVYGAYRGDNTGSKRYQVTRSPSNKVPAVAFKIVIARATRCSG